MRKCFTMGGIILFIFWVGEYTGITHFRVKDKELEMPEMKYPPYEIKRIDTQNVIVPRDTTPYKGNWVDPT